MAYTIGIDVGGTFTDLVAYDPDRNSLFYSKTLTRYSRYVEGVIECLQEIGVGLTEADVVKHGTTEVINAFVQRSGARAALVTTRGFRDSLEIGRANRPIAFQLRYDRTAPLIPRPLRFEIEERIDSLGSVVTPLSRDDLARAAERIEALGVEAIAVSFLNAYQNPQHEREAADWLGERFPGLYVTTGSDLTREWFEYERTSTAVANAYVGPAMTKYLDEFNLGLTTEGFRGKFYMMASNGGILGIARAQKQPIALVESGPIGGCIGASALARALGLDNIIAFDMGGTTAKCALVNKGEFEVQSTYYIGGYEYGFPLRTSVVDIVEVGAGGGSIASVDAEGRLRVGPRSAGSEPGPAAYRRGGIDPTVTDANLVLGRIGGGAFLNGELHLDVDAARHALLHKVLAPLELENGMLDHAAHGVLAIATTLMAGAITEITGDRGHDVRTFALVAFGGGGPLHASELAWELHIPLVIIPPEPGNFSALGMLLAQARVDGSRTFLHDLDDTVAEPIQAIFDEIADETYETLRRQVAAEHVYFRRYLELRYKGQKHTVRVGCDKPGSAAAIRAQFEARYRDRFGHADSIHPVEIVALRVVAFAETQIPEIRSLGIPPSGATVEAGRRQVYFDRLGRIPVPVYRRDQLPLGFVREGPAIIEEYGSTTVVGPADRFSIGELGEIRIHCDGAVP